MIAFDGGVFNGAVHAFDLSVGPRMFDLGETVFDFVFLADAIKEVHKGLFIALPVGELDAVIGQNMRDFVRHGGNQVAQEVCRDQCEQNPACATWTRSCNESRTSPIKPSGSRDYFVLLDGSPSSCGRFHVV